LLRAADLELVGSSRTGVTGFVRCRTDDLIFDRESRTLLEQRSLTLKRTYDAVHNGPVADSGYNFEVSAKKICRPRNCDRNSRTESRIALSLRVYEPGNPYRQQPLLTSLSMSFFLMFIENTLSEIFKVLRQSRPTSLISTPGRLLTVRSEARPMHISPGGFDVGKHAVGASCLDVICVREKRWYSLRITDNGAGSASLSGHFSGRGTAQAKSWPDTCEESSRDGLTHLRELSVN